MSAAHLSSHEPIRPYTCAALIVLLVRQTWTTNVDDKRGRRALVVHSYSPSNDQRPLRQRLSTVSQHLSAHSVKRDARSVGGRTTAGNTISHAPSRCTGPVATHIASRLYPLSQTDALFFWSTTTTSTLCVLSRPTRPITL